MLQRGAAARDGLEVTRPGVGCVSRSCEQCAACQQGDKSQSGQGVHRANSLSCVFDGSDFPPNADKAELAFRDGHYYF
jgi:hypothetical protein